LPWAYDRYSGNVFFSSNEAIVNSPSTTVNAKNEAVAILARMLGAMTNAMVRHQLAPRLRDAFTRVRMSRAANPFSSVR